MGWIYCIRVQSGDVLQANVSNTIVYEKLYFGSMSTMIFFPNGDIDNTQAIV